jgi:hypothetical protein
MHLQIKIYATEQRFSYSNVAEVEIEIGELDENFIGHRIADGIGSMVSGSVLHLAREYKVQKEKENNNE